MYRIEVARSLKDVEAISSLARIIWREYYPSIIGDRFVEYMLSKHQDQDTIKKEIFDEGYKYYIIYDEQNAIGYCGVHVKESRSLNVSKLYIKKEYRGKGLFKTMLGKLISYAKELDLDEIELTCNKNNLNAINIYKHVGFVMCGDFKKDMGGGFAMDDYKFKLRL